MTRSKRNALLWSLAGVLMLIAAVLSEPFRLWMLAPVILYFAVAVMSYRCGCAERTAGA